MFVQTHILTSYSASLLNRDDAGFAKRTPFGGSIRTRVSTQCLKRHWREHTGQHSLLSLTENAGPGMAVRSRYIFEDLVYRPLLEKGIPADLAQAVTEAMMIVCLGESAKARKVKELAAEAAEADVEDSGAEPEGGDAEVDGGESEGGKKKKPKKKLKKPAPEVKDKEDPFKTEQVIVLGRPEIKYILAETLKLAKLAGTLEGLEEAKKAFFTHEWRANIAGLRQGSGLDAALFGRMVTSSALSRVDAAVHVAHAFTVHSEMTDVDYFGVGDNLRRSAGSAHIGSSELTSGLYYCNVVIDVPLLVSNCEGCSSESWMKANREFAAKVVRSLMHTVTTVSPGAKLGSTAPYAYASLLLVETGVSQPRSLANAFLRPVDPHKDLLGSAFSALADHIVDVDSMYDMRVARALAASEPRDRLSRLNLPCVPVANVADFAAAAVLKGV